ncbi:MAG: aspartate/glutamate racemase family protein, partial [Pseudomonadota bacterium]
VILDDERELDIALARADMIAAAEAFQAAHPKLGAILLECTNMVPYQADVARATGLPVFSIYDFICWFQGSLRPRRFPLD